MGFFSGLGWGSSNTTFYRATAPRVYVDSAPHTVANGGLTLSGWRNAYVSLRYRHIGSYRLDGQDPTIRASGLDVLDLALTKPLRSWIDLNFDVDNLTNKTYYETQNYFESRITPDAPVTGRIHGTPGYPFGLTPGLLSDSERKTDKVSKDRVSAGILRQLITWAVLAALSH